MALAIESNGGAATAADPRHPVVQGYGATTPMPEAKERSDRSLRYRVLFSITKPATAADQRNPGLEKAARFVNLLGTVRDQVLWWFFHVQKAPPPEQMIPASMELSRAREAPRARCLVPAIGRVSPSLPAWA